MQSRIEVLSEGSYVDAFREGVSWLSDVEEYKEVTIKVTPHFKSKKKTVAIIYERKESTHE